MTRSYDAIVLGLGGIGSGAAYWLARAGQRVLGLEQFAFGHARGESDDHSRIIRLSYHAPHYVRFAKMAYEAWDTVERESGEQLVYRTGGLDLGPADGAIPVSLYAQSMECEEVPFERLDAAEIRRRWPPFVISDDVHGLYQSQSGLVAAARATATHQRLAEHHGATLLSNTRVTQIHPGSDEIVVEAGGERYAASHLVVAAGPWSAGILSWFDVRVPLEVTKEQVHYFVARELDAFALERFPVWIWMDDPSFYGFPVFGEAAVKVTQDAGGQPVDPDGRGFEPDDEILARTRHFLATHLPSAVGPARLIKTCLYTLTPDRDFIIDTLREHPNVSVAVGAGHAFKFASLIGRVLAELSVEGKTSLDLAPFSFDRPILHMSQPPKNYLV
ncbi:MAG: N-methyl-L-tryptophan oxidase [Candidatus Eremiobacteraeota bacterium]|nr:N-methyl-L-tryptophan oxidase [Candidatus Eremiobacteraeota bacterium]